MAFTGAALSSQVITIPNFHWFRGRTRLTVAAWVRISSHSLFKSYWRQDGVLTPVQYEANGYRLRFPSWTPTLTNHEFSSANYGASIPLNVWHFCVGTFSAPTGFSAWRYTPESAVWANPVNPSGLNAGASLVATPSPIRAMVFGGTEGLTELMQVGDAIAECAVFPYAIPRSRIVDLAHDLSAFRREMVFYAPFRDPGARATEAVGRGVQYRMEYGTTSRSQILPEDHPPVERMRTGTRVFMSAVGAERLRFSDGAFAKPTATGATLRVRLS